MDVQRDMFVEKKRHVNTVYKIFLTDYLYREVYATVNIGEHYFLALSQYGRVAY